MGITNVKWIGSSLKQDASNRLVTDTEKNTWNGKANSSHTHDDRYYTESEINTKLNGKANSSHSHTKSQITDFPTTLKNPSSIVLKLIAVKPRVQTSLLTMVQLLRLLISLQVQLVLQQVVITMIVLMHQNHILILSQMYLDCSQH